MARKLPPSAYVVPVPSTAGRRSVVNVFGTPRAREWVVPEGGTEVGRKAAELQHEIAHQLRDTILLSEWGSLAEFARQHESVSYDRLRGVLSGDIWMRFEDIVETSAFMDLRANVTFTVQDAEVDPG